MKLILKLSFLFVAVLILSFCHEVRDKKTIKEMPLVSYKNNFQNRSAPVSPPPVTRERGNITPEEREELRLQRARERAANLDWIKESVQKYSPGSWYMLMEYDKLPESNEVSTTDDGILTAEKAATTFHYLKGRSRIDMLASMETNVHEIAHAYFDQNVYRYITENKLKLNPDNAQGYIYISPSKSFFISFPLRNMFPSGDLAADIPDNLRTYRFDTYILGNTSTQSDGVIGLLNELNAYYLGSEYCFSMLGPYKEAAGSDAAGLFEWVTHTQSTMSAFYEFDFFIKEYLLNMRRDHEADYEKLRSYNTFSEAYTLLCKLYTDLIERYEERIKGEMKLLNSSGEAGAGIEKGWLWIKPGDSHISSGTPIFSKEKETLLPVLESRRYREVEKDFPVK